MELVREKDCLCE